VANHADSVAYQVERQLRELGTRAPANERARAEQLIAEVRSLVKNSSPDAARLRQLSSDLQQIAYGLSAAASGPPHSAGPGQEQPQGKEPGSEDVIDAEFRRAG
jgi:molecular chaperone DnaK